MSKIIEPIDTGSNYPFGDKQLAPNFKRSTPNLSHGLTTTIPKAGYVYPILVIPTVPSDEFEISVDNLIRVLPQVVPLMSRQRAYIHGVFARYTDLWEDGDVYMTKGPTGKMNITKPVLNETLLGSDLWTKKIEADDLLHFLDLPIGFSPKELSEIAPISALPLFMYFKSVVQLYWSKNPLYLNRVLFPLHPEDFRLSTKGEFISNKNTDDNSPEVTIGDVLPREWAQGYFSSCLPFPQRGSAPTLNANAPATILQFDPNSDSNIGIADASVNPLQFFLKNPDGIFVPTAMENRTGDSASFFDPPSTRPSVVQGFTFRGGQLNLKGFDISLGITLDDIRSLTIDQLELERMAKTDGTFFAFGMTFFGIASRNARDFEVTYVGGAYQGLQFSEVLQTSQSSNDSPLGTYAGHGLSRQQSGYIGRFRSDEHGIFMLLLSIMPDEYYCQGLPKYLTRIRQEEEFLPGRDQKGMIGVLNREIFVSGDAEIDNDLWAYQDPFDDMRYMPNRVCGKVSDPGNESFKPYTQARFFESTPKYSHEFMLADDVRTDYLFAGSNEDAYICQFYFNIKSVRPISFRAQAAQVIN